MKIENTGSGHTSLQIETVDVETEFPDEKINGLLSKINSLSRVFIRRHVIHKKRFDILNEDGEKVFQLDDISSDTTSVLNYMLASPDGTQLISFTGNPGLLSRNGSLVVQYGSPTQEVKMGTISMCSSGIKLVPKMTIQDSKGQNKYHILDKSKHGPFSPFRKWAVPIFELISAESKKKVCGRIDERRLTMTSALMKQSLTTPFTGRRSVPATGGLKLNNNKKDRHSTESAGDGSLKMSKLSLERTSGDMQEDLRESPTHNHFCVAFDNTLSFNIKVLFIGALFLVNDDVIRKDRRCTRLCCGTATLIILFLLLVAAILIGCSLTGIF